MLVHVSIMFDDMMTAFGTWLSHRSKAAATKELPSRALRICRIYPSIIVDSSVDSSVESSWLHQLQMSVHRMCLVHRIVLRCSNGIKSVIRSGICEGPYVRLGFASFHMKLC